MTVTQYRRGTDFERKVKAMLTEDGYLVVKAGGSKGVADLVAIKPGQVLLISCKLGGPSAVPRLEWNAFLKAGDDSGALAVVASRPARGKVALHLLTEYRAVRTRVETACRTFAVDEVSADG